MARKAIIVGNGLGMAHDPEFFALDQAINAVWDDQQFLDEPSRLLVSECIAGDEEIPQGEDDLGTLQKVLSACDLLSSLGRDETHWLSSHGREFPSAVRQFLYLVALRFHEHPKSLPDHFVEPFCAHVEQNKSHVATLNYDPLLYDQFVDRGLCDGYSGSLLDGFRGDGFSRDYILRKGKRRFGFYLHLHGSPLFIDEDGVIRKMPRWERNQVSAIAELLGGATEKSAHVVLTHFDYKEAVIRNSEILSCYWEMFEKGLYEASEIILFGYSGRDIHLNRRLHAIPNTKVRVIEWEETENKGWDGLGFDDRQDFWNFNLKREVSLEKYGDILDFSDW